MIDEFLPYPLNDIPEAFDVFIGFIKTPSVPEAEPVSILIVLVVPLVV